MKKLENLRTFVMSLINEEDVSAIVGGYSEHCCTMCTTWPGNPYQCDNVQCAGDEDVDAC